MSSDFPQALLTLNAWDQLSVDECEQIAYFVETLLPSSFRFSHIESYAVGTQRHLIALFEWHQPMKDGTDVFALIPGNKTTLGFDRAYPYTVPDTLVDDWQKYCVECRPDLIELNEYLKSNSSTLQYDMFYDFLGQRFHPHREVTLLPFLLEVVAHNAGELMPPPILNYFRYKTEWKKQGYVKTMHRFGHSSIPHRHVVAFLRQNGFRLPSVDEWEYACAAGSSTLFYWGNKPFRGKANLGTLNKLCNAFGLEIASDTYNWEYCGDPTIVKGGDGGCLIGYITALLALAPAHYLRLDEKAINNGVHRPYIRRVYDFAHLFK